MLYILSDVPIDLGSRKLAELPGAKVHAEQERTHRAITRRSALETPSEAVSL